MTTITAPALDSWTAARERCQREEGSEPSWLREGRVQAWTRFTEDGFPTSKKEAWRFTNVGPLKRMNFLTEGQAPITNALPSDVPRWEETINLVMVDGVFDPNQSDLSRLPEGVIVGPIMEHLDHPAVRENLIKLFADEDQVFLHLNTSLFRDGFFISIPRGHILPVPVVITSVTTARPDGAIASFPRHLFHLETGANASILERYHGPDECGYLTVPVTGLVLEDGAVLNHYRLQLEGDEGYHVSVQKARLARSSTLNSTTASLTGRLIRNDTVGSLEGEGADANFNGLYLTEGKEHVDNQLRVDHRAAHCTSHELYKGVLDGRSRAVFNGLIHVFPEAQKTDAVQTNRNLILSAGAKANTNPQLEIYADDVKCTHGSTIGQLDPDAVFYLRSRGLGQKAAESLLTWAFAAEVVNPIPLAPLRQELENFLLARLPRGEIVRQAI